MEKIRNGCPRAVLEGVRELKRSGLDDPDLDDP